MRAYGIKIDPTSLTLSIPSPESKTDIVVQGYAHCKPTSEGGASTSANTPQVFMLQMVKQDVNLEKREVPKAMVAATLGGEIRVDWYEGADSEGGMSQEGEGEEKTEKKEKEVTKELWGLLEKYRDCFVERAGLGRVNIVSQGSRPSPTLLSKASHIDSLGLKKLNCARNWINCWSWV